MKNITKLIKVSPNVKVIFSDLFDTLIHRNVHPNYVFRLWAKFMVRELGLSITADELYIIRNSTVEFLSGKLALGKPEIPYDQTIGEVYRRILNNDLIHGISYNTFERCFKEADYRSEIHVQFRNKELISELASLKEKGFKIYLVSDFHMPKTLILKMLEFHGFSNLFSEVFISTDYGKSKQKGNLYNAVLEETNSTPGQTIMLGDNKKSDYINSKKNGLNAIYLRHLSHKLRNKRNLFGNDRKDFVASCRKTESKCRKSGHPLSEYIIHYYFFIERLYEEAKKKKVKDLFFLAREGLYLKKLFETYQEINGFSKKERINTHYFKASRQSAIQVSLKPLHEEQFRHLKRNFGTMSLNQFLKSFHFSKDEIEEINREIAIDPNEVHEKFVTSPVMSKLRTNRRFENLYDIKRDHQKKAFMGYLNSFNVDFKSEGMVLVDVGWGGTMQECIHNFLEGTVDVSGFYLGLRQVYNIEPDSKRYGLNFSVYPSYNFSDHILMANTQIYEQLLAAPHGSTMYYNSDVDNPTVEFHEENEKRIFHEFISPIQDFMFDEFVILTKNLRNKCYNREMVQNYITDLALRIGLRTSTNKLKFIHNLSQGFHQNIGNKMVGLTYSPSDLKISKITLLKQFLWSPEKIFRYLVKVKPMLYGKGKSWLGWPVDFSYYYILFNHWLKKRVFQKKLI